MSLEANQGRHNGFISHAGNASASNDPHQMPHDANELLRKGAAIAASMRELGLSEEETLAAVSRKQKIQERARQHRTNKNESEARWRQSQKTLVDEGFKVDSPPTDVIYDDDLTEEQIYQGQTDYEAGLRNIDRDDGKDTRPLRSEVKGYHIDRDGNFSVMVNPVRPQETESFQPEIASKNSVDMAMREVLKELDVVDAEQARLSDQLSAVMGGGRVSLPGSTEARAVLERNLADGSADLEMQRFLAAELAQADRSRVDPERVQYNQFRAEAESQAIARDLFTAGGLGSTADEAIGRIAEIRKLGGSGALLPTEQAQVIRMENDVPTGNLKPINGVYVDPNTGNPVAMQGPDRPAALQGANTPNNAQMANAPAPQTAATWMQANIPDHRKSTKSFGDYPQVDIIQETTNFANRMRELKGFGLEGISANVRSPAELQRATDFIVRRAAEQGKPMYRFDEGTGRNVRSTNPGVAEVMNLLRMSPMEQQKLANALYQTELSVNTGPVEAYRNRTAGPTAGVNFDAKEMTDEMGMQSKLARIPKGSTIGTKDGRESIRTIMEGLEGGPMVTKGEIGQVEGERPRINRRKPGGMGSGAELEENIRRQAESRAKGKPVDEARVRSNQVKARLAEERQKRDERRRAESEAAVSRFRVDRTRPVFGSRIMNNLGG